MTQFGPSVDLKLEWLAERISEYESDIGIATEHKDKYWEELISIMDEFQAKKFIHSDGTTFSLQEVSPSPELDEGKLLGILNQRFQGAALEKILTAILVPKVDSARLEKAALNGLIPYEIIQECLIEKPKTIRRVRRRWSEEDREKARELGIEKEQ